MRYRSVDNHIEEMEEQRIISTPPPPRDPNLRFGFFYNRADFMLLEYLSNIKIR